MPRFLGDFSPDDFIRMSCAVEILTVENRSLHSVSSVLARRGTRPPTARMRFSRFSEPTTSPFFWSSRASVQARPLFSQPRVHDECIPPSYHPSL